MSYLLKALDKNNKELHIVLYKNLCVTLRYVYQPNGNLRFTGSNLLQGRIKLYPKEEGSYRPPARAHFSFKQNRRVAGGEKLDVGIEIDQQNGKLYFGGWAGRFDHCTDLGEINFNNLASVNTDILERKREDTLIKPKHVYLFESNIYEPRQRTKFTGFDVSYAKIFVESIEYANILTDLKLEPQPPIYGKPLTIRYRAGSADLDGARNIYLYWATYDDQDTFMVGKEPVKGNIAEFPSGPCGTTKGDFNLRSRKCVIQNMIVDLNSYWTCQINIPSDANSLALLFVDELGRTAETGIMKYNVTSDNATLGLLGDRTENKTEKATRRQDGQGLTLAINEVSKEKVDQSNLSPWNGAWTNVVPENRVTQTFQAQLPLLKGVAVDILTGNPGRGGDTITVKVLRGNNVLATASQFVAEGFDGLLHFDLPNPVEITLGETLKLECSDTGKVVFGWRYGLGDTYPYGTFVFNGVEKSQADFFFQTYGGSSGSSE